MCVCMTRVWHWLLNIWFSIIIFTPPQTKCVYMFTSINWSIMTQISWIIKKSRNEYTLSSYIIGRSLRLMKHLILFKMSVMCVINRFAFKLSEHLNWSSLFHQSINTYTKLWAKTRSFSHWNHRAAKVFGNFAWCHPVIYFYWPFETKKYNSIWSHSGHHVLSIKTH